jgi:transcriptional regulator with XRE-family HTH domain
MDIYRERIKPLFESTGMTDIDLERAIGLPRSIIYKWDNGINQSFKKYSDLIASYFNVTSDYILGNSAIKKPATISDDGLTDEERDFIERYRRLSPDRKKFFSDQVQAWSEKP